MNYGLWLSAAGMQVTQHQQAVIANNLANLGTVGFKRDLAMFRERSVESRSRTGSSQGGGFRHPLLDTLSGGTFLLPTMTDFTQSPLENGGTLDTAIDGNGFFSVKVGQDVRYTRDGRFTLNKDGDLVTVAGGNAVLDESGQAIHIGEVDAGKIAIDNTGGVFVGDRQVGTLGLTDFDDRRMLIKAGKNTFDGRYAKPKEADGQIRQGFVEASGVEATTELVQMIEASRAYQFNATLISYQDGMLGRLATEVGRVA